MASQITALPTPPARSAPATFSTNMDAFLAALPTFRSEANALSTEVNAEAATVAANTETCSAAAVATAADRVQTGIDAANAAISAASAAAVAGAFVGTSTSSLTVGAGEKTFTTQAGERYSAGIWMTAVSQADVSNWMFGEVISYSGTTLVMNVTLTGGSGTHADWNLSLAGPKGPAGNGVTEQSTGFTLTGGTVTPKTLTVDKTASITEIYTPTGTVIWFAANAAPDGYLKANGAAISRTTYATLFTAIGTTFGTGDGSTTFNLPDLRGEFIRGWDDSRGIDSGRTFGSAQTDAFKAHTHVFYGGTSGTGIGAYGYWGSSSGVSAPTDSTGGTETRPRNKALLACIKY